MTTVKYVDINGLSRFKTKIEAEIPTKTSELTNDSGYITSHQDISGKLDVSKVKTTTSTTAGDVYDVTYINSTLGDIETLLGGI